ncbi:glycosyltransferase family 4 protein [Bacillus megaterium]|nr:glycosyltransferase family 4 protein [Priestia megaterium]
MDAAIGLNKPIILCLHDLVYMHFEEIYYKNQTFYDEFTVTVNQLARVAEKIVFNSNYIRNHEGLIFLKLPKEKTEVIRLAPPIEEYETLSFCDEKTFREKYKLHGDYIVYPTVIRHHKNCDRLIEAFLRFKQTKEGATSQCRLIFTDHYINSPQEKRIKEILNNYNNHEAHQSIVFIGRLPWDEVPLLYKFAIGTIIPTLFEGSCPFQILESLTMNTPVAISNIEVIKELLPDTSPFITFNPYSLEEMEKAIYDLWKRNKLILEQQKAAIEHIFQRKWADVAEEYNLLIDKIISLN